MGPETPAQNTVPAAPVAPTIAPAVGEHEKHFWEGAILGLIIGVVIGGGAYMWYAKQQSAMAMKTPPVPQNDRGPQFPAQLPMQPVATTSMATTTMTASTTKSTVIVTASSSVGVKH